MHTLKNGLAAILVRVDDGMDLARAVRRSVTAMNTGIGMTHSPIPPDRQGSRWGRTNRSPSPPQPPKTAGSAIWSPVWSLRERADDPAKEILDELVSADLPVFDRVPP